MLTTEQGLTPVGGFHVYDMLVIKQMIEKLLRNGLVTGSELAFVASMRTKVLAAALAATGINIEEIGNTENQTTQHGD